MTQKNVFQAIADPTRRAILTLLAVQALTPNAIAGHFKSSRQAVSKHIKVLADCGVIGQKQTGREIHYHLKANKMKEVDMWLDTFRKLWKDRFNQLDDVLKDF